MAGGIGSYWFGIYRLEVQEVGGGKPGMKTRIISKFGSGLLVVAVILGIWWVWQGVKREAKTVWVKSEMGKATERVVRAKPMQFVAENDPTTKTDDIPQPSWKVPDSQYSIYIPEIAAISKVIGDIDAGNPQVYEPALKQGVVEAAGLAHPGEVGTTYLFSHSVGTRADLARYNAVFYLLHKLSVGAGVELVYQGKWLKYVVEKKEILAKNDVKYLVPQNDEEKLVLSTCYPPGTTWKRLVVVAKPQY